MIVQTAMVSAVEPNVAAVPDTSTFREKRQAIAARIDQLSGESKDSQKTSKEHSERGADLLLLLRSLDAIYARCRVRIQERAKLAAEKHELESSLETLDKLGLDEPKPYSFLLLERVQDQLAVEEDRRRSLKFDVRSSEEQLKDAHGELAQAKTDREEGGPDSPAWNNGLNTPEPLRRLIAQAKFESKQADVEGQKLQLEVVAMRIKLLEAKIATIKKDVAFSAQDRDQRLRDYAASEAELHRGRRSAEYQLQRLEDEGEAAKGTRGDERLGLAQMLQVAAEANQSEVTVFNQRLEVLASLRKNWRRRYELATGKVELSRLSQWNDELTEFLDELDDVSRSLDVKRDWAREQHGAPAKNTDQPGEQGPPDKEIVRDRTQRLLDACTAGSNEVKVAQRGLGRFKDELKGRLSYRGGAWGSAAKSLAALLSVEVTSDEEHSVTLGTLLVLLIYVLAGGVVAYTVTRLLSHHLLPRLGLERGTVAAIRTIAFYVLCAAFGLISFHLLHVPMAAFAFLGGAAAIAVGFGSQDIMNNFMSGIILLTEQPIRAGDIVDIGGSRGVVLHIGLRSTRVQTEFNHELIVPNKTLIDEQVTNYTLSDNLVRLSVAATVDRELNVEQTKWQMLEIVFAHPMVIKSPRPVVLLKEVDTYWLIFEVHFWMQYSSFIKSALVQSEILEVIGDRFAPKDTATQEKDETSAAADTETKPGSGPEIASDVAVANLQKFGKAAIAREMRRVHGSLKLPH